LTAVRPGCILGSMASVPPLRVLLSRAWRLRCPACGRGPVFARGIVRARTCASCGWRLERDEGHWLGGSEVHMVACYGAGSLLAVPLVMFADVPAWLHHGLALGYLAASAALYRPARAVFLALDFAVDPPADGPPGPGGGPGPPPAPPRPRRRAAAPVPA